MNFGLIGYPLEHSYSKQYFNDKFIELNLSDYTYSLFPIKDLKELLQIIKDNNLSGFNVTSPYKNEITKYLDEIDESIGDLKIINFVTVKNRGDKYILKGYNTDIIGIEYSLEKYLVENKTKVLILGNGCTSATCQYYFRKKGIEYLIVTRNPIEANQIHYKELTAEQIKEADIIINTTTLGLYPDVEKFPPISYQNIESRHICFDVIYNPAETEFLKKSGEKTRNLLNGSAMFKKQAEESWKIIERNLL